MNKKRFLGILLGTVLSVVSLGVPAFAEDFSAEQTAPAAVSGNYIEEAVSAAGEDTSSPLLREAGANMGKEDLELPLEEDPETLPGEENPEKENPEKENPEEGDTEIQNGELPLEEVPEGEATEEKQEGEPLLEETDAEGLAESGLAEDTLPAARDLTYTGEAQELLDAEGIAEGSYLYSLDGEAYDTDIPTGIDAGEYTVYVKPAEDPEAEAAVITVEIKKADVIFTAPVSAF